MPNIAQLCAALAIAYAPFAAMAQDATEKRGIRFVCTEIAPDTPETLKLLGKKGLVDVALGTRMPGELFQIPSDGTIMLGEESGDPEKPIKPFAMGKLPANTSRATALLIPATDEEKGMKYEMFVIADGGLKGGSAYFLNLTNNTCMAKLDGKVLKLKTRVPVIFQPDDLSEARNSPVAILVETREVDKKGWRPLMASTWRLRETRIEVCIVYWNEEISRPSIKGLTLFPMGEING